jgi:putative ABC transport system substrate-binding protein
MKPRAVVILALALGLLAAPLAAEAQRAGTIPHLGILLTGSSSSPGPLPEVDAFMKRLGELGWVEGQNLAVDRRWAETPDRFSALAEDLTRLNVNAILALGPDATHAARTATSTTPIVMVASTDPRQVGVTSFAHPSGNLTGFTVGPPELVREKRLELLKEAIPRLSRVAVVWDVSRSVDSEAPNKMDATARSLGLRLQHVDVKSPSDFAAAFKAAKKERAGAILLIESPRAVVNRALIAELGLKHRLPVMSEFSRVAQSGGLMSYGPDLSDLLRRAATYVDKILKGAKPADLPIEQPTKFELVINMKTAKALGLTIPPSLLLRADQVIE